MAYISPDAKAFYLSKEAFVQLQFIPKNFPKIGSATAYHEVGRVTGKVDTVDAVLWLQKTYTTSTKPKKCHLRLQKTLSQK